MEKVKAFKAHGKAGHVTRETAKAAALAFFAEFPSSRKCNIIQGEIDGGFFFVTYVKSSNGEWPMSYKDVTKKTVHQIQN